MKIAQKTLLALTLMTAFAEAGFSACPRSRSQLMCPGDTVVSPSGSVGKVVAINRHTGSVSYEVYSSIYSADKKSLALGEGCLGLYCVGDTVVSLSGSEGEIVAVNPYLDRIAYKVYGSVYLADRKDLALALGCSMGVCVGDKVVTPSSSRGTVTAINRSTKQAAVKIYGSTYIHNITALSSTNYCETYGDREREYDEYPFVDESMYTEVDFIYSRQRAVRTTRVVVIEEEPRRHRDDDDVDVIVIHENDRDYEREAELRRREAEVRRRERDEARRREEERNRRRNNDDIFIRFDFDF